MSAADLLLPLNHASERQNTEGEEHETHRKPRNDLGEQRRCSLSAAFYHNMLSDLAFELSNPTIKAYASEVLLVALGRKSYDTYLDEMTSLLT
jgi:hypothetical protein